VVSSRADEMQVYALTEDHKLSETNERNRVLAADGVIFQ
jgi:serine/threonine protein phosphatase PrpC